MAGAGTGAVAGAAAGSWAWPLRRVPRLLTAGRFRLADRDFQHRYWQASVIAIHLYDYHARLRLDGSEFVIAPDVFGISPSGCETRYHLDLPGTHWCVHFQQDADAEAGAMLSLPLLQALGARAAYVRERFIRIAWLFDRAQPADHPQQVAAGAALQELLCWLAATQTASAVPARSRHAVEHAAELLRSDFTREWTVPKLAQAVGLSANYLAARFREHFMMTIVRYRLTQRIHQARLLLAGSDVPVGEVARRVGIPDPHHFNKLFRRITGGAPSAARKKADG